MKINSERLEALDAILDSEEDDLSFYDKTEDPKNPQTYFMTAKEITVHSRETKESDSKILRYLDRDEFLLEVVDRELVGRIFLGWEKGKEAYADFLDWEEYAKRVGVSKLVTLSFKVPEAIAKRFKFFADENSNTSTELRGLAIGYVKKKWQDNADSLIFKESV